MHLNKVLLLFTAERKLREVGAKVERADKLEPRGWCQVSD